MYNPLVRDHGQSLQHAVSDLKFSLRRHLEAEMTQFTFKGRKSQKVANGARHSETQAGNQ